MNQPLNAPSRPATATGTTKASASPRAGWAIAERTQKDQRRERAGDRHQRADRQVDAAGGDDERHADRDDDDRRHLGQVDVQRLQADEMRRHREIEREQHDERGQRGVAAKERHDVRGRGLSDKSARQPRAASPVAAGSSCAIAAMIADALACGMRQIGDRPAVAQNEDAVRALDDLLELRRDHQHAEPLVGELADQRLDLGLGADVDAACRLVENQQLRIGAEPARQQHLLLVAAGELADLLLDARGLDGETFHELVDNRALAALRRRRPSRRGAAGWRA